MKNKNGQIIIEVNDCVQVAKGENTATFGMVIAVKGPELVLWGRSANTPEAKATQFTFRCDAADVFYIGKGKLRPMQAGEERREATPGPNQQASSTRRLMQTMTPKPKAPESPSKEPEPRSAPFTPQQPPKQQAAPKAQSLPPPESVTQPKIGGGSVPDAELIDLRPKPRMGDDVDPKLLEPAVFSGPNARDMHGKPVNPTALTQPETVEPPLNQGVADDKTAKTKTNPFRISTGRKAKAKSKSRKGVRGRKKRGTDVGIPVEGTGGPNEGVLGGLSVSQVEGENPTQDNNQAVH